MPQGDRAFLSYSRDDKDFVWRLASDLKAVRTFGSINWILFQVIYGIVRSKMH